MTDFKHGVWYPISTIPEDLEVLIAYDEPHFGVMGKDITIGYYDSPAKEVHWNNPPRKLLRPTHWTPLPNPPEDL